jgi:hypothetical protein
VHHCKPVKVWLAEHRRDIEAFSLPRYSPELNPEERPNANLKQAIGSKVPVRTKAKLRAAADEQCSSSAPIAIASGPASKTRSQVRGMKTSSCRINR